MNDQPLALDGMGDERRSTSPKRKKIRQKYAPKACVSCRRSKLKCSGENPCQRCIDNGKRCFYSEDETAAQVLQTLSRPTRAPPHHTPSLSNGNGLPRRNIIPRHGSIERRASDASMLGATMETRMARIETMMEALCNERGMTVTPMGSIERGDTGSDGMQSEAAYGLPLLDPINPALAHMDLQASTSFKNEEWMHPHFARSPSYETPFIIRLMDRELPFPCKDQYLKYLSSFFEDIYWQWPCIEESNFRSRGLSIFTGDVKTADIPFLALNYTILACCNALLATCPAGAKRHGWHYFEISRDLVDRHSSIGIQNPLERVQLLLFDAVYFCFSDLPGLAYDAIRLASTHIYKQGLHQQVLYSHLGLDEMYSISRIVWNVFIVDHWISLSCRRPCSIREEDIKVQPPDDIFKVAQHTQSETVSNRRQYTNAYMKLAILLARKAGLIQSGPHDHEKVMKINAAINCFLTDVVPTTVIPQIQINEHHRTAVRSSSERVTLLLLHQSMATLQYDAVLAHELGAIALGTIQETTSDMHLNSSVTYLVYHSFRHQLTSAIAAALLVLCSLLVRDLVALDLALHAKIADYARGFRDALDLLHTLGQQISYAKRVLADFEPLLEVVRLVVDAWQAPGTRFRGGFDDVKRFVPLNIVELFPYRAPVPFLENGMDDVHSEGARSRPGSLLWLF